MTEITQRTAEEILKEYTEKAAQYGDCLLKIRGFEKAMEEIEEVVDRLQVEMTALQGAMPKAQAIA